MQIAINQATGPYDRQLLNGTECSLGWGIGFSKMINRQKLSVFVQWKVLLSINRLGVKWEGGRSTG